MARPCSVDLRFILSIFGNMRLQLCMMRYHVVVRVGVLGLVSVVAVGPQFLLDCFDNPDQAP